MRDVFFDEIYECARNDRDIIILSADFSAPSLDKFRLNLPAQYQFMGISEQNMMLVAAGLALEGKKPICYAIAPFLVMRCFEQTRLYASGMNLPITLAGVGAGISYEDSGYTHHAVEDIALMRSLPNMKIYLPCDNEDIRQLTEEVTEFHGPAYLRLDRYGIDRLFDARHTVRDTYTIVSPVQDMTIAACGSMMSVAINVHDRLKGHGIHVGLINVNRLPLNIEKFAADMHGVSTLITMEEHTLPGGLGSALLEAVSDCGLHIKVSRYGLKPENGFFEGFGGREELYELNGMDADSIIQEITRLSTSEIKTL